MALALAIHGGAWNVPDGDVSAHRDGISRVLISGWDALAAGGSAIDVVESVVRDLEDDPTFNAGRGAHLNSSGTIELDASIMEGEHLSAGAVGAVERIRHPVTLARHVMDESPHVLLVGRGARAYAVEHDIELCRTKDLLAGKELERFERIRAGELELVTKEFDEGPLAAELSTVGAVACDAHGLLAAATSTGGTQNKRAGRVGDSAVIGAGTYADNRAGAVSSTGWGEGILRLTLAKAATDRMANGMTPGRAGRQAVDTLARVHGRAGLILVDANGRAAAVFNTPRMARGLATESRGLLVGVDKPLRRP